MTNKDILDRAADILEGIDPESDPPVRGVYEAIEWVERLQADENPGGDSLSAWTAYCSLRRRLGSGLVSEWEQGRPISEIVAVLRGGDPVSFPGLEDYLDQGIDVEVIAREQAARMMQASEEVA